MAPIKGCRTRILVGGIDLSGDTNAAGVSIQSRSIEYGVLQDCDVRRLPMTPQSQIEHRGYYSGPAAGSIESELNSYLGNPNGINVGLIYDTDKTIPFAYIMDLAYNQKLALRGRVGQLITIEGMWNILKGSGARMYRGYQVAGASVTATGAVTGIDFGAAGSAGGKLFVFVTSITGTATNATIKLQSDSNSDHSTTSDEGTATFSGVGCQVVSLSATVNRYQRMNVTSLGGATGFTFYAISCIDGVTY